MKSTILLVVTTVWITAWVAGAADRMQNTPPAKPPSQAVAKKTLARFGSERELEAFLRKVAESLKEQRRTAYMAQAAPAPAAVAGAAPAMTVSESITNVQHAGVDEGGIVKVHGDHLVVLRRGRLFTIAIGGDELRPVSSIDAFAPEIDPKGTWYDEMLVSGSTIIVIGYSYQRGGTEIGLFDIDGVGRLRYRSTYHLRSNDYYSSRNYSSRLIGTKLVFYTPLYLRPDSDDPFSSLPALRRWRPGATTGEFRRIVSATRIYRTSATTPTTDLALHTVTVCDLARTDLDCDATVVMGPAGRVFYVSPQSVYVWTTDWSRSPSQNGPASVLYQMPLDGAAPTALRTTGSPVDQFSFLESADGHLNVLVRANAAGDGMWSAEVAQGDVALFRVARDAFSDGSEHAPASSYRALPKPQGYTFQNRFVGRYLLYGTGSGWGRPVDAKGTRVYAVQWSGDAVFDLRLPHGVDRIESLGNDAVVVGTSGRDLHFTAVRLVDRASLAGGYVRPDASQGELRSHGFFYKADGTRGGVLGLPISRPARPGYKHLFESSAAILFLRNQSLSFSEVGELAAQAERAVDDKCRASCVDWYGNARPLFVGGRVLALLGYEVVEAGLTDGRMQEKRRVSFAPSPER